MKKNILVAGMMIVGLAVMLGFYFFLDKKQEAKKNMERTVQETIFTELETERVPVSDLGEETTEERETEETLLYTHPESYPEEEPDPENAGELDGIEINIYFTNMETVDDSGLLPYNAWEYAAKNLQMFLNFEGIEVYEVQAIDHTIEQTGDTVTFYAMFPELPGKTLKLEYDIRLRKWSFLIEEEIKNEEIEESSVDNHYE